tara:strand:- start:1158 stop:1541 length:384 start_codon:yes stop_codon:yes gene_type:complete
MEKENYHEINKREYAHAPLMSHYEQMISFLNRYFIFKKMRDLSESTLKNLEQDLDEEADAATATDTTSITEEPETQSTTSSTTPTKRMTTAKTEHKPENKTNKTKTRKKLPKKRIVLNETNYSPLEK